MRQVIAIAVLALFLVASASANKIALRSLNATPRPQGDYCTVCATFMQSQIAELEDIIVQIGIVDGCNSICGLLPNQIEASVCSVLCEYVGVNAFINYINVEDPDPLYICMELGICPIVDTAAAKITSFVINPQVAKHGQKVQFNANFQVINATGVGEIVFEINPPSTDPGQGVGEGSIFDKLQPGLYQTNFEVELKGGPNSQEPWTPGVYQVIFAICEGSCGSVHPHSYTLDQRVTSFKIVSSKN